MIHKTNNTPKQDTVQPKTTTKKAKNTNAITDLVGNGSMQYDIAQINKFVDTVFHAELYDDEHILSWTSKNAASGYPKDIDKNIDRLEKTNIAKACYFGTSTVVKDPQDGKLYNRKSLFKRLHVVVLDDIGTKIKEANLPLDLIPNYIIESSEGNYQYGFILDEPIEDYELAEALIHLVYTSGYSDTGGKMPTKKVRMPCGVNGKEGDKGKFEVKLVELNDEYWSPSELLEVLDVGVSWDDVVADTSAARQGKSALFSGTSLWSPIRPTASSLNGVIDPILEWLYERDLVKSDDGQWVTIECPWHEGHTSGESTAGYSPIGRGGESSNRRGFKCFHDHCSEKTTVDFLQEVAEQSGIEAPVVDNVADLVADYAFVANENSAYKIRGVNKPTGIKVEAFKNLHNKKVAVYDFRGKEKLASESALWLSSPNRLAVQGLRYDPANNERVVKYDGLNYLNTYAHPQWGKGSYDEKDIKLFKHFMEYLIPNKDELDYFMQWLSAKAQDPTFKGAAVLMVAPSQGTGRTTLTDMVRELFTPENVKKVTFSQLCGAVNAGAFNDFIESGLVTCDEIMSESHNKYKVYESLKDLFDPRPKEMVVNTKYGKQRSTVVYTSYLLLTNHRDAIGALGGDRRVYVINNPKKPAKPEYFGALNRWLSVKDATGQPKWARSVWRWLQTLTPDLEMLHEPAPMTEGKREMVDLNVNDVELAIDAITEFYSGIYPVTMLKDVALRLFELRLDEDAKKKSELIVKLCKQKSFATDYRLNYANNKKKTYIRISDELAKSLNDFDFNDRESIVKLVKDRATVAIDLTDYDIDEVARQINQKLADRDI